MKVSRKEQQIIHTALQHWEAKQQMASAQRQELQSSLEIKSFDWHKLAHYAFWGGVTCLALALWTLLMDDQLVALLERLFNLPPVYKAISFSFMAVGFWWWGASLRKRSPKRIFSYDPVFFLGVISAAVAVLFLGQALDTGSGHYTILILLAALVYLMTGWFMRSALIWACGLIVLGIWFGFETGYHSDWGEMFWSMNYPLRFVFFGAGMVASSYLVGIRYRMAEPLTRSIGMTFLFIALWMTTFIGNDAFFVDLSRFENLPWIILMLAVSVATIWAGLKTQDEVLRGFGLVFLLINLYSRYFEYFWNEMHTTLFLIVLAFSFWVLGKYAEKLWLLGK